MTVAAASLVLVLLSLYLLQDYIRLGLTYGWDNPPTHIASKGCSWEKESFQRSGISFFLQTCTGVKPLLTYSEDAAGRILRTSEVASGFTMETRNKQESQSPLDVMTEQFAKLTSEQRKVCQIQSADLPIEYLPNGTRSNFESPHPTPHKTRYEIGIKKEIVQGIVDKYEGMPDGQQYDYLCGKDVGSPFAATTPYFEFDDRSPGKYLFVGSLGNDGSVLIDLNSIRF
jgi:hypothetical protein